MMNLRIVSMQWSGMGGVETVKSRRGFQGLIDSERPTGVHHCWDSGRFIVVIAMDIMVDVFLLLVSACSAKYAREEKLTTQ